MKFKSPATLLSLLILTLVFLLPQYNLYAATAVDDPGATTPQDTLVNIDVLANDSDNVDLVFARDGVVNRRCLGDGTGGFSNCINVEANTDATFGTILVDVNGDTFLDVVFSNLGVNNRVCLGDGMGNFTTPCTAIAGTNRNSDGVDFADLDGVNGVDLVFATQGTGLAQAHQVCLNNGAGVFTCANVSPLVADAISSLDVAIGQIDGAGGLDAVFANFVAGAGNESLLCLGTGTGTFTSPCTVIAGTIRSSSGVAIANFDGVNGLDVVFSNRTTANQVCLNDGTGVLTCADVSADAFDSRSVGVADFDGINGPDIMFGNAGVGARDRVCLNNGAGTFTCSDVGIATTASNGLTLGDVNEDGDIDVIFANQAAANQVCLNNGSGGFPTCNNIATETNAQDAILGLLGLDISTMTIPPASVTPGATVTILLDGTIDYTPPLGFVGIDTFDYTIEGATATVTVDVTAAPVASVAITKTPATQTILAGNTATFTITVTNTGAADLTNVTVSDPLTPACAMALGTITVGNNASYMCTTGALVVGFTNTATVTTTEGATDNDSADVIVQTPNVAIDKSPATQTVVSGNTATFTITVTNTGTADLTGVTVTDPLTPACDAALGTITVGNNTSYMCTTAPLTTSFTNTATVTTTEGVTDNDSADVTVSTVGVSLVKSPANQTVNPGNTATFTITITNTGTADLSNVTVTDPLTPACDMALGTLTGGTSTNYNCTTGALTTGFTNTATVTSTEGATSMDSAVVNVSSPGGGTGAAATPVAQAVVGFDPAISKIGFLQPGQLGLQGEQLEWIVTVFNNGTGAGTNVVVSDTLGDELRIDRVESPTGTTSINGQTVTVTIPTLAPGQMVQFSIFTTVLVGGRVDNTACVTGDNFDGEVCATALPVSALPSTGQTPLWALTLRSAALVIGVGSLAWLVYRRRYH